MERRLKGLAESRLKELEEKRVKVIFIRILCVVPFFWSSVEKIYLLERGNEQQKPKQMHVF